MNAWSVRVNAGRVRTEKDAEVFHRIQRKWKPFFDTHEPRFMWFHCKTKRMALGFAGDIVEQLPYLSIRLSMLPQRK